MEENEATSTGTQLEKFEKRIESLEEKVLDLLSSRRWFLRAIAVISLTVLGQVVFAVLQELVFK